MKMDCGSQTRPDKTGWAKVDSGPQLTEQEHVSVTTSATPPHPPTPPNTPHNLTVTHHTHAHEGERGKGLLLR